MLLGTGRPCTRGPEGRAHEERDDVVGQLAQGLDDEPVAAALDHVAEQRDDALVRDVERGSRDAARSGSAGRASTKWGTTATLASGTRPASRRRSSSEWTTTLEAAMPRRRSPSASGRDRSLPAVLGRVDVVEREDRGPAHRAQHDLQARDPAEARVPVGHLPLEVDDVDVAEPPRGSAQVRPGRVAVADVALDDLEVGTRGGLAARMPP